MRVQDRLRRLLVGLFAVIVTCTSGYAVNVALAEPGGYGCCAIDCATCYWGRVDCNPNVLGDCINKMMQGTQWTTCCVWHDPEEQQ
jgi:hypothetical protein